jgi:hypothetical protein
VLLLMCVHAVHNRVLPGEARELGRAAPAAGGRGANSRWWPHNWIRSVDRARGAPGNDGVLQERGHL